MTVPIGPATEHLQLAGERLLVLLPRMPGGVRGWESRRMTARWVTGIVLAAGSSRRLGTPKQLLPYGDTTVLGATLDVARGAGSTSSSSRWVAPPRRCATRCRWAGPTW